MMQMQVQPIFDMMAKPLLKNEAKSEEQSAFAKMIETLTGEAPSAEMMQSIKDLGLAEEDPTAMSDVVLQAMMQQAIQLQSIPPQLLEQLAAMMQQGVQGEQKSVLADDSQLTAMLKQMSVINNQMQAVLPQVMQESGVQEFSMPASEQQAASTLLNVQAMQTTVIQETQAMQTMMMQETQAVQPIVPQSNFSRTVQTHVPEKAAVSKEMSITEVKKETAEPIMAHYYQMKQQNATQQKHIVQVELAQKDTAPITTEPLLPIMEAKEVPVTESNKSEAKVALVKADVKDVLPTAVTETPVTVTPISVSLPKSVEKSSIAEQIGEQMTLQLDKMPTKLLETSTFTMQLKPEGLGEIVVKMSMEESGKTIVQILVANSDTKNLLHAEMAQLKEVLKPLSAEVQEIQSYVSNDNFYSQSEQQSNQAFERFYTHRTAYQKNEDTQEVVIDGAAVIAKLQGRVYRYI